MDTKTARIPESHHEEISHLAEQANVSIPVMIDEILTEQVDYDEAAEQIDNIAGICPECGAEIPSQNVKSPVLSTGVRVHCPEAERDDDVHVDQKRGKYEIEDIQPVPQ